MLPIGDKAGASSVRATTPTDPAIQLAQTVTESAGKARNRGEEIAATDNDTSISSFNPSSVSVPPRVSAADKSGVSSATPGQQLQTFPQAGSQSPSPDRSNQKASTGNTIGTPLANEVGHEATIPLVSPAMNDAKIQSLWNKAANDPDLSAKERETLATIGIQAHTSEISSALESVMGGILKEKKGKEWKIKFRGDDIVLGHVGMKILHWLNRFKEIGDIIIQFDPVHAALPWAGLRFLLKVEICILPLSIGHPAYIHDQ